MSDINTISVSGNLAKDPVVLKQDADNNPSFVKVSIGCSTFDPKADNKKRTSWFDVLFFGGLARMASQLEKGMKITVAGRLEVSRSKGKDGKIWTNVNIYARDVVFPRTGAARRSEEPRSEEVDYGSQQEEQQPEAEENKFDLD